MKNFLLFLTVLLASISLSANATEIYAHRGGRGLTPENTIPSYKSGMGVGIDYVDMDINMTKDGVVVVQHNFALNPDLTKNVQGKWIASKPLKYVKDMTLKELETYTVGELKPGTAYAKLFPDQRAIPNIHIPTLRQVIEYVKNVAGNNMGFQIEIKTNPAHPEWTFSPEKLAKAVAKIIEEEGIKNRTEVQAFDFRVLQVLKNIDPQIATAYLTDAEIAKNMHSSNPKVAGLWSGGKLLKDYDDSIPKMVAALGGKVWGPQGTELTPKIVEQAHELGLKVVPWSWPEKTGGGFHFKDKVKLVAMGVDGIITDRPDILRGLLTARGMRVPPGYGLVANQKVREANLKR